MFCKSIIQNPYMFRSLLYDHPQGLSFVLSAFTMLNHIAAFVRSSLHLVFLKLLCSLACLAFTIFTFAPCMLLHLLYLKPTHALISNTLSHPHLLKR
jgi:hypothetical protein